MSACLGSEAPAARRSGPRLQGVCVATVLEEGERLPRAAGAVRAQRSKGAAGFLPRGWSSLCPADWSSGPGAIAVGATGAKAAALLRVSAGPPLHPRACGAARHPCPQPRAHDLELAQVPAPHRTGRSSPGGLCKGTDQVVTAVGQGVLKPELPQHHHDGLGPCDCPRSPGQSCPGSRVGQVCPTPPGSSPGSRAAQGKPAPPWVWIRPW